VAFALQADGWYLRQDIIWAKPNPMPESVTDRCTKGHEYLFLLSKRERYYFDQEAISETSMRGDEIPGGNYNGKGLDFGVSGGWAAGLVPPRRNRRSVWTIPSEPFPEAHFATFPQALVEPCIMASTSERGHCPKCGKGWRRILQVLRESSWEARKAAGHIGGIGGSSKLQRLHGGTNNFDNHVGGFGTPAIKEALGWSPTCTCGLDPVPGIVLDPFAGSGTVAQVAQRLGRRWLGIDLNPAYAAMIDARTRQLALNLAPREADAPEPETLPLPLP
jgi:hypothetical protein